MTVWEFALDMWRRPGVEATCLALQDHHGQCVPLLLWRLWTLAEAREVDPAALAAALAVAREWDAEVLAPLRAARARLGGRPDLARRALAVELAAEREILDALEIMTGEPSTGEALRPGALVNLAEAWRPPAPAELLGRLVAAL